MSQTQSTADLSDNSILEQLECAIAAFEEQRLVLGDNIVDTAISTLKERLVSLQEKQIAATKQKKFVSVLFMDLTNYTTLLRQVKPEEMLEFRDSVMLSSRDIIEKRGGRVLQFMGDGLFAVFGIPDVKEDDAEQAIRAGLDILSESNGFELQVKRIWNLEGFAVRVGVDTGQVIVGGGIEAESSAIGMTVNLAARMEQTAPPGTLQITHESFQQVYGIFDVEAQPPLFVKGVTEPLKTYLVRRALQRTFHKERYAIMGIYTPMVGRESELERLRSLFKETLQNSTPHAITILGEAGIGKSRLLAEFELWLERHPGLSYSFRTRGFRPFQDTPYGVLRMLIANYCSIKDSDPADLIHHKLQVNLLKQHDRVSLTKIHFIAALLGFPFPNGSSTKKIPDDPQQVRTRALYYLSQFFQNLTGEGVTLILVEDAHWADDPSIDFLVDLWKCYDNRSLYLVYVSRPELLGRRKNWFETAHEDSFQHTLIELSSLSKENAEMLICGLLKKVDSVPDILVDTINSHTEGNPLYIEELIRSLTDDVLRQIPDSDSWTISQEHLEDLRVPPTLTGLIQSRVDRLPKDEKDLLQKASVVGRTFWESSLSATNESRQRIQMDLQSLIGRDLIYKKDVSTFIGDIEYSFRHSLLRDAIYETVLIHDRHMYHGQVAEWLTLTTQESGREDKFASIIARHHELAGQNEPASDWYLLAGKLARDRGAIDDSLNFLDRSLEINPLAAKNRRMEIMFVKNNVLLLLGNWERKLDFSDSLIEIALELDDDDQLAEALASKGNCLHNLGRYLEAQDTFKASLAAAQRANSRTWESIILSLMALNLQSMGEAEQAADCASESLEAIKDVDDDQTQARTLINIGVYFSRSGDIGRSVELHSEAVPICERGELTAELAVLLSNLGYEYTLLGLSSLAVSHLLQANQLTEAVGTRNSYCKLNLGLAYFRQGDYRLGLQTLNESKTMLEDSGNQFGLAAADFYRGLILEKTEDYPTAIHHYKQAKDRFTKINLIGNLVDAMAGLARCSLKEDDREKAHYWTCRIWEHLSDKVSSGIEFPALAYLTCARTFEALDDSIRADMATRAGYRDLMERAERIGDAAWRKSFLNNNPEHLSILRRQRLLQ